MQGLVPHMRSDIGRRLAAGATSGLVACTVVGASPCYCGVACELCQATPFAHSTPLGLHPPKAQHACACMWG